MLNHNYEIINYFKQYNKYKIGNTLVYEEHSYLGFGCHNYYYQSFPNYWKALSNVKYPRWRSKCYGWRTLLHNWWIWSIHSICLELVRDGCWFRPYLRLQPEILSTAEDQTRWPWPSYLLLQGANN